jgi:nitroreductase
MMDALQMIMSRRSIRSYSNLPVSEEAVETLLRAAMHAPSAGNQQPWHFVVIRDRSTMEQIMEVHPYSKMLAEAPVAILVCGDDGQEDFKDYWVQDCSAATENILLAATAMGLGSVWLGIYPRHDRVHEICKIVGLPHNVTPLSLVPIGYPNESKPLHDRYQQERVHKERW